MENSSFSATLKFVISFVCCFLLQWIVLSIFGYENRTWYQDLLVNLCGYSLVFGPGIVLFFHYRSNDSEKLSKKSILRFLFSDPDKLKFDSTNLHSADLSSTSTSSTTRKKVFNLAVCFLGLQTSYLIWGLLQEKIMTKIYRNGTGRSSMFRDSQFLVFVNRFLAFVVASIYVLFKERGTNSAPFYKYSFCSLTNILSSWCQYEALKFISFPTQVLSKASKIIPVMLMGKIVLQRTYDLYEYVVAVLISFGMVLFLMGSSETDSSKTTTTTFTGFVLLVGYMGFDAFTSNWQGNIFQTYKVSSMKMMAGVNLFSCLLTVVSLVTQESFQRSVAFMIEYPKFVSDCVLLSLCSASGQLFIYSTISQFGPVVFVIIMTLRQAMAILLSCIIYSHPITPVGIIGVLVVFAATFLKIYCGYRIKKTKKRDVKAAAAAAASSTTKV